MQRSLHMKVEIEDETRKLYLINLRGGAWTVMRL